VRDRLVFLGRVSLTTLTSSNYIICLLSKFKAKCVQSAALLECVQDPAPPVCTPVTLTYVVTVATGVRSAVKTLDNANVVASCLPKEVRM